MDYNAFLDCLAAPGDKWGCVRAFAGWQGLFVFWAFVGGFTWCGLHLNRKDSVPLADWLRNDTIGGSYKRGLTRVLTWLDQRLCPPEYLDVYSPRYQYARKASRAWNWRAYDRMLLLAVVYPFASLIVLWILMGQPQWLGTIEIIPQPESVGFQSLVLILLLAVAVVPQVLLFGFRIFAGDLESLPQGNLAPRKASELFVLSSRLVLLGAFTITLLSLSIDSSYAISAIVVATLLASFLVLKSAVTFAIEMAGIVEFTGAVAVTVGFVFTTIFTLNVSFFVAIAITSVTAFSLPLALLWANRDQFHFPYRPSVIYVGITVALISVLPLFIWFFARFAEIEDGEVGFIIFLAIFPLFNAIFDFASLGLTRFTLRRSLSSNWLGTLAWYAADLIGALIAFVLLIIALMFGVHVLNTAAGTMLIDLGQFFADISDPDKDMTWAYLMVFSTLLPTVAHALFFYFGLALRIPGPRGGVWLAGIIDNITGLDDRRFLTMVVVGAWCAIAAALLVGLFTGLTFLFGGGHADLVTWVAAQAEAFARTRNWITP